MGTCGVYVITHVKSGKFYVGSTGDLAQRIRAHKSFLKLNRHKSLTEASKVTGMAMATLSRYVNSQDEKHADYFYE